MSNFRLGHIQSFGFVDLGHVHFIGFVDLGHVQLYGRFIDRENHGTGAMMCRVGDILESSIAEEFPLLQGLGLTPARGDCVSRGWSRKLATAANDGKGGAFYAKPPGRF